MDCKQVELLLAEYALPAIRDPAVDWQAVDQHVQSCPSCQQQYREVRQVVVLLQTPLEARISHSLADQQPASSVAPGASSAGWQVLRARIEQEAQKPQRPHKLQHYRFLRTAMAAAACLAVCFGLAGVAYQRTAGKQATLPAQPVQSADSSKASPMGWVTILDGQKIIGPAKPVLPGQSLAAAEGQQLKLRIWDRHDVVLEPGTRLAVNQSSDHGCVIALSLGQATIAVTRAAGEGPFRIVTPQAELTVLGTQFTVSSTFDSTCLAVQHGIVQMASRSGQQQNVPAGQIFATDGAALTQVDPGKDCLLAAVEQLRDPVLALRQSPWYRQRFAPLLHLAEYLHEQNVPADELTLLAISAEPWCLQQPKDPAITTEPYLHRQAGLARTAQFYGYQAQWLSPADGHEAMTIARQAMAAGDMVLVYGLASQPVTRLTKKDLKDLADQSWQYRFLGGQQAHPRVLCRVSKADSLVFRPDLVQQALADARQLLVGEPDEQYWVGRAAIEQAAGTFARGSDLPLGTPLLKNLSMLAKLGPICQQCLNDGQPTAELPQQQAVYAALTERIESLFAVQAFEATQCSRMQRQDLAESLCQTLQQCMK